MENKFTTIKPLYEEEVVTEDNQKSDKTISEKFKTDTWTDETTNGLKEILSSKVSKTKDVLSANYWTNFIHSFIL